jgi:hypothetical protein
MQDARRHSHHDRDRRQAQDGAMDGTVRSTLKVSDVERWDSMVEDEAIDFCRSLFVERDGLAKALAGRQGTNIKAFGHVRPYANEASPALALSDFKVSFLTYARSLNATAKSHYLYWRKKPTIEFMKDRFMLSAVGVLLTKKKPLVSGNIG